MQIRGLAGAVVLAALAVAGCDRSSPSAGAPGAGGFSHAAATDISGYYAPLAPVRLGRWSLTHVFVGRNSQFENWEGGARNGPFGPVMLQFASAASRGAQTEPGEAHGFTVRVLPTRYSVTDTAVRFEGDSAELGRVTFTGVLDQGALATARRNLGGDGVVLAGDLTAAGQTVHGVRLMWSMGG